MKRLFVSIIILILFLTLGGGEVFAMGNRISGTAYNLLLITIDTLRADHLGCYGYPDVKTPVIDQLASEGVTFTQAFTPVPITLPSHVTIMTGQYPIRHGIRNNGNYILPEDALTIADVMKAKGYRTGACIGAFVLDAIFGLDQGFDFYDDSLPKEDAVAMLLENERRAEAVTQAGLNWLESNQDAPFFLWLHYFDPHAIYLPPSPFKEEYKSHLYDGEIAYTDKCIGDLFQGMKKLGLMDKTVVILTSDHGEGLGEHGEPTHAIFIYDATLNVPLIISAPQGILPTGKIHAMVSIMDIFPTIIELFALSSTQIHLADIQGKSLIPLITGQLPSIHNEIHCESLYPELNFGWSSIEGIRTPEWKYIKAPRPELYHLTKDPKEENNIYSQKAQEWQEKLASLKMALGPDKSEGVELDDEVKERLESLGYIWSASSEKTAERPDPKDMIRIMEGIDRGVSYIYLGFYDQAREEFQKILKVNPENASALFYLASIEERTGRLGEAETLFRRLLKISPNYLDVHNHLGVIYHKQGQLDKALKEFQLAIDQAEYSEVYYNLSVVYRKKGKPDESIQAAQKALELDPKYADAFNQLGQLAIDRGDLDEAGRYLRQAIQLKPDHLQAHNNLGVLFHHLGQEDSAIKEFEIALSIDPNNAEAHNNIGSVYLTKGLYEQAEMAFKKALRIKPDYLKGLINLGTVQFYKGDYTNAMDLYLQAIEYSPENHEPWFYLGLIFLAQNEFAEAHNAFEKALQKGPESADLYFNMGQASFGLNQFDEALTFWEKAIALNPDNIHAHLKMGQLLFDMGMIHKAIESWEKAYDLNPEDPAPLLNMATARFQCGEYPEAISLWEKAIQVNPALEEPYLHIGTAYLRQNDIEKASQVWESLLQRKPDHVEALINLGTARYEIKDIDGAIKLWEQAANLDNENPKIHYNLGLAFFNLKDYSAAVSELREALRLEPDNSDILLLWQQARSLCPSPCE